MYIILTTTINSFWYFCTLKYVNGFYSMFFLVIIPHNLTVILGEKRTKQHVRLYHFSVRLVCLSVYFCLSVSMYFFDFVNALYSQICNRYMMKCESIDIIFSLEHLQVIVKIICFIRVWLRITLAKNKMTVT